MEDVCKFFCENEEAFTVYVVEQRFALGRGHEYFKSFKGKNNPIDSDIKWEKLLHRIVSWMSKNIPEIGSLIGCCFGSQVTSLNIADIISCLSKLFGVELHQAAGPYAIDPIIIEEGNVLPQYVTKLIMGTHKLPFLAARYAMNVIAAAYAQSEELGVTLVRKYSIKHLLQDAMASKRFGTGQLALQMGYLQEHYVSVQLK